MNKIVVIKESSLLRDGMIHIFRSIIPGVTITAYSTSDEQKIFETENMGDLLFIDVDTDVSISKVIQFYQDHHKKIIALISDHVVVDGLLELFQKGLNGYIYVDIETKEFISAISTVINGENYIHPALSTHLLDDYLRRVKNIGTKSNMLLTVREWEVFELVSKGLNNEEVGHRLEISAKTVRNHVSSILGKLNVSNRTNAVSMALKNGWIN